VQGRSPLPARPGCFPGRCIGAGGRFRAAGVFRRPAHRWSAPPSAANISLRCRRHNQYEAERIFGPFRPSHV